MYQQLLGPDYPHQRTRCCTGEVEVGRSSETPFYVRVAQALFFTNAAIWLVFGVVSLIRMGSGNPDFMITALIIAVLMFGNVGAMLVCGIGIRTRRRLFYYLAIVVLAINIVLTFTDQVGAFDVITVVVDLLLLGLLIATRKLYFRPAVSGVPAETAGDTP